MNVSLARPIMGVLLLAGVFGASACRPMSQQAFAVTLPATQVGDFSGATPIEVQAQMSQQSNAQFQTVSYSLNASDSFPSQVDDTASGVAQIQIPTNVPTATETPIVRLPPSATPRPTNTNSPTASATATNTTEFILATNTPRTSGTSLPTLPPIALALGGGLDENGTPFPTWTPPASDPSTMIADHYYFGRPIADGGVNWVDRTYPYGGTSGGRLSTHSGVEFVNPSGTPVLSVESGTVFYAGDDASTVFGPYANYYGYVIVIQHNVTTFDGQPVFSLYGHLSQVDVQTGQPVSRGEAIGYVGASGIAMGPHLHFEVRVGSPYDFNSTRNPELWIRPYPRYGTLAGRVTDSGGNMLPSVTIRVESTRISRYAFSYAGAPANSDTQFGENYTLGDLPADYYLVTVGENGRVRFRQVVYVFPNRTTWLNITLN